MGSSIKGPLISKKYTIRLFIAEIPHYHTGVITMNLLRLLHNKLGSLDAQLTELKHMLKQREKEHEQLCESNEHWQMVASCLLDCQELEADIIKCETEIDEVEFEIRQENWLEDQRDRYNDLKRSY